MNDGNKTPKPVRGDVEELRRHIADLEAASTQGTQGLDELRSRLKLHSVVIAIASRFLASSDLDEAINTSMAEIGGLRGASRVYLFRFSDDDSVMINTHEWCAPGVRPEKHNLQSLPSSMFPWWMARLRRGELIDIPDVSVLPADAAAERAILESQGIRSLLVSPVHVGRRLVGFIGFDDVTEAGHWIDEDITVLRLFCEIVGSAFERRRAEAALRESEERFRTICENAPIMIHSFTEEGRCTLWNRECESRLGWTQEEVSASDEPLALCYPDPAVRQAVVDAIRKADGRFREYRARAKDGSTRVQLWADFRLPTGALISVGHDITGQKRAEQALRDSEQRFRAVVQDMPVLICRFLPDGVLTFVNAAYCHYFGGRSEELIGRNFFSFIPPEDQDAVRNHFLSLTAAHPTVSYEHRVVAPDGAIRWQHWIDRAILDDQGMVVEYQSIGQDITERKQSETIQAELEAQLRQAQKIEAVGRLAGGVAHDFNNLLTVILGRSQLLLSFLPADDPARRHVDLIQKTGDRAATLTRQLLAFSRKQLLEPRVLDLNTVAAGVEKMLHRLIGEDIELVTDAAPNLGLVNADPGQLEQVLMNLAVNARDAMPHGGTLTLSTANVFLGDAFVHQHPGAEPGPHVMLAVADTGAGMTPEVQAHLFEPFFTTKGPGKGTGLGLATVYGIVKQHGGYVVVDTEPGRGSTFRIYLPEVDAPSEPPNAVAALAGSPRGSETVLLVEDEPGLRDLAGETLEMQGYTVMTAADGEQALRLVDAYRDAVHLLVTDVIMPQMSGRVLADRLASVRPETRVLYISGYTDDAIVHHGVLDGHTAFLHKPFTPEALARKVREVLDAPRRP